MTGDELALKPGPTDIKGLSIKRDDKINKTIKYGNDLMHDFAHNFNKHSVSNFNKITSVYSKFDTLNKFHKKLIKLQDVRSKTKETKQKKIIAIKMYHCFMMNWLASIKNIYNHTFKAKINSGG